MSIFTDIKIACFVQHQRYIIDTKDIDNDDDNEHKPEYLYYILQC